MNITSAKITSEGLLLETAAPEAARFVYGFKPGDYEITLVKKKRSLNANDYCWALCTQIAEAIRSTKDEIYQDAIKAVGVCKDFHTISLEDSKTLMTAWGRQGIGWLSEQVDYEPDGEHIVIRCYYGSSVYNSRQMARLIDWLVDEAKGLGLETKPQEYVNSLLEEWHGR